MKVMIVEDDSFKFSRVSSIISESFPECQIFHHDNVFGAVNFIKDEHPELIVLDMSLPSHPAVAGQGSPVSMPAGGIELILEIKRLKKYSIPILILTQYHDVEVEYEYYPIRESGDVISRLYGITNLSVVHYDHESYQWVEKTKEFIGKLS